MADAYVSTSGDDAGAGTIGDPFETPDQGASVLTSGANDTLYYNRGDTWTWTDYPNMDIVRSSTTDITITAYGSGDLPLFDFQNTSLSSYDNAIKLSSDCSRSIVEYLDIRNVGVESIGPTEGSGVGWSGSTDTILRYCNFEDMHDHSGFFQSLRGDANLFDSNTTLRGQRQSGGAPAVFGAQNSNSVPDGTLVTWSNNQNEDWGTREGCTQNKGRAIMEDNEQYRAAAVHLYIDGSNVNSGISTMRRNLIYDDRGNHSGSGNQRGLVVGIETFNSTAAAEKTGSIHMSLNLISGIGRALRLNMDHADTPDPMDDIRMNKNSLVDNEYNFSTLGAPSSMTNSEIQHNISMPLSSGTNHDDGNGFPSGMDADYNYWHTSQDSTRHSDLTGANDLVGTDITLTKTSGWQSPASFGAITSEDYRPTTSEVVGTLTDPITGSPYTDYDGTENHNEYGGLLESSTPEPPADPPGNRSSVGFIIG